MEQWVRPFCFKALILLIFLSAVGGGCGKPLGLYGQGSGNSAVPVATPPSPATGAATPKPGSLPPSPGPTPNTGVLPPQPIVGSYLLSCGWHKPQQELRCLGKPEGSPGVGVADPSTLTIRVSDQADGRVLSEQEYEAQVTSEGVSLALRLAFRQLAPSRPAIQLLQKGQAAVMGQADLAQLEATVVAYQGAALAGAFAIYPPGEYRGSELAGIASLRVPPASAVELCDSSDKLGQCQRYYGDISTLLALQGRLAYLGVAAHSGPPFVSVFDLAGRSGQSYTLPVGTYTLNDLPVAGQWASVHIAPNLQVEICKEAGGATNCQTFDHNTVDLPSDFRGSVKQVQVRLKP